MRRRLVLSILTAVSAAVVFTAWPRVTPRSVAAEDLGPLGQSVSEDLMARLKKASDQGLAETSQFNKVLIKRIENGPAPSTGAPLVLYVGADFCPYCAALRWPLVLALMRFGDLTGLRYMRSSGSDVYPNTATFTFDHTRLESDLIEFQAAELEDRNHKRLQKPAASVREKFLTYDKSPYTRDAGSIPFLYLGGKYVEVGSPLPPKPLQGLDWQQITARLEGVDSILSQDVLGEANILTAAMCALTGQEPDNVCAAPAIKAAAGHLPH